MLQKKQDKFKIFLLGVLFVIPPFVSAQNSFQKEFNLGLNGGITISSVNFIPNTTGREGSLLQGVGGVSFRYISEKNFGIQCELNYSQRGWQETFPEHQEWHYSRGLDYLELPILTHIYFDAGKRFRGVFNLGPQLGYLLNERIESTIGANEENIPRYYTDKVHRPFDWGLCFGGGLEFRANGGSFVLDGRYYYGLSDIFTNSRADKERFYFAASSNQIISVKLTYFYKVK